MEASPASDTQPNRIFAVRRCHSLKGPAIFFCREDLDTFLKERHANDVEFQECCTPAEALVYLKDSIDSLTRSDCGSSRGGFSQCQVPNSTTSCVNRPSVGNSRPLHSLPTHAPPESQQAGAPVVNGNLKQPPGRPANAVSPTALATMANAAASVADSPAPAKIYLPIHPRNPSRNGELTRPHHLPCGGQPGTVGGILATTTTQLKPPPIARVSTLAPAMPPPSVAGHNAGATAIAVPATTGITGNEAVARLNAQIEAHKQEIREKIAGSKRKRHAEKFQERIKLLREYKQEFGTCDIPRRLKGVDESVVKKYKSLGLWVVRTRQQIRAKETDPNAPGFLDATMIQQLKDIGFTMEPTLGFKANTKRDSAGMEWERMFQELKKFKDEHGHTDVPHKPKTGLRGWILTQRWNYRQLKEGKPTMLTAEKIAKMTELGFSFLPPRARRTFDDRIKEWIDFKTKHGCEPNRDTDKSLSVWATKTRTKYAQLQQGEDVKLTQEQIDRLTKAGFRWVIDGCGRRDKNWNRNHKPWDVRYQELLAFKEANGHTLVPQNYPELGGWTHKQRTEYKRYMEGKKSYMTVERIKKLNDIGFVFKTRNRGMAGDKSMKEEREQAYDSDSSSPSDTETENWTAYQHHGGSYGAFSTTTL